MDWGNVRYEVFRSLSRLASKLANERIVHTLFTTERGIIVALIGMRELKPASSWLEAFVERRAVKALAHLEGHL